MCMTRWNSCESDSHVLFVRVSECLLARLALLAKWRQVHPGGHNQGNREARATSHWQPGGSAAHTSRVGVPALPNSPQAQLLRLAGWGTPAAPECGTFSQV